MSGISYIHENEVGNKYKEFFSTSKRTLSREDVATILETFQSFLKESSSDYIKEIRMNSQGYFIFVVGSRSDYGFDFYKYINENFRGSEEITCANALYLFPRNLSRGVFPGYDYEDATDDVDDVSTGYMDEEELEGITCQHQYSLRYLKTNVSIPITDEEVIIGRSVREATFVIQGNTNVSRNHCTVCSRGKLLITDHGSLNGTYVNGLKLTPNTEKSISVGDKIMVADEEFLVE